MEMIVRHYTNDNQGISEPMALLAEVSLLVSQLPGADEGEVIAQILWAARSAAGLTHGTAFLCDYMADQIYVVDDDKEPRRVSVRSQISGGSTPYPPAEGSPLGTARVYALLGGPQPLIALPLLTAGSRQLGELGLVCAGPPVTLGREQKRLLEILANLAAIAIDRCMRRRDLHQLHDWLDALPTIFAASRAPRSADEMKILLQEIANNALKIARSDFVVLYEYFEERGDVRLPATLAGSVLYEDVPRGRGVAFAGDAGGGAVRPPGGGAAAAGGRTGMVPGGTGAVHRKRAGRRLIH